MSGIEQLVAGLRAVGLDAYPEPRISGFGVRSFHVRVGRFAGKTLDVASTIDYPDNPPGGLHIHAQLFAIGSAGGINVQASPLGPDWQYFSRSYQGWKRGCNERDVVAYINKVFLHA